MKDINIVKFDTKRSAPKRTIIQNNRRYGQNKCAHKGPFIVDEEKWTIECDDCGALLNPVWCLIRLAKKEAYYSQRIIDLAKHLEEIDDELKTRERTKCTHCGNMTAIRLKNGRPRTWIGTS